jgi:putative cofactor-binding repeat protein
VDAQNAWLEFNALYLGAFSVAPTVDNEGDPLQVGALYWNTGDNELYVWTGTLWEQTNDFDEFTPFLATGTTTPRNLVTRTADVVNVKDFGAKGDGVTNDTVSIQAALNWCISNNKGLFFSDGTYLMGHCTISGSISIVGNRHGSIIKRLVNFDANNVAEGLITNAHFAITSSGIEVSFNGLTFDGNEANQSASVPAGQSIQFSNNDGATTGSSTISIEDCTFKNQTLYAINLNGGSNTNEQQVCTVRNCSFLDGRKGVGSGDPSVPNVNGFAPFAIQVADHITLIATHNKFIFRKPLASIAEYAPSGIRWTFLETTINADGASGIITNNYFHRYGRKNEDYQGNPTGNNGLGCTDFYGRGREIIVSNNKFDYCFNSAIRGKVNVVSVSITGNEIHDTPLAINIGPNTADSQAGNIVITGNSIRSTEEYGIGVIGNVDSSPNYVEGVTINGNHISGVTNPNGSIGNTAGILVRYAKNVTISGNTVETCTGTYVSGIKCRNIQDVVITGNRVQNTAGIAIFLNEVFKSYTITGNSIEDSGNRGISIDTTSTSVDGIASNNMIQNAVDYGIIQASDIGDYSVCGNIIKNITGLSRGIYVPSTVTNAIISNNISDATAQLFNANIDRTTSEFMNNWNQSHEHRTSAPTTGTWVQGDIVWDTTPTSGGFVGFICVASGTPGTWKTFGSISV